MAINFGLAQPSGGYDYLETLRALGQNQALQQDMASQAQRQQIQGYQFDRVREQDAARPQILQQAQGGDSAGAQQRAFAIGDYDALKALQGLDEQKRGQLAQQMGTLGRLATSLIREPDLEKRRASYAAVAPLLVKQGFDPNLVKAADLSDGGLQQYIAAAGSTDDVLKNYYSSQKPMEVSNGASVIDPQTGRVIYQAPVKADWQFDSESGSWLQKPGTGTGGSVPQPGYTQGGGGPASTAGSGRGAVALSGNNPGGINDGAFARSQPGYTGANGRFAGFATLQDGVNAQKALLRSYIERGYDTPAKIARRWAPAADGNDPRGYASNIASMLGVSPNTKLSPADVDRFQDAQARQENAMYPQAMSRAGGGQAAGGQPGVINVRPPKRGDDYRLLTAQEKQAQGLDVNTAYQVSGKGQITAVGGQDKGGAKKGEADLRKEFQQRQDVKDFYKARTQFNALRETALNPRATAQDDIAVIFQFMKTLDPTSTVREGEFATAQNATGVPDAVRNAFNKAQNGERLNPQQRRQMAQTAYRSYQAFRDAYNTAAGEFRSYASDYGVNPDRVARTYTPDKAPRQQGRAAIGVGQSTQVGGFKVTRVK